MKCWTPDNNCRSYKLIEESKQDDSSTYHFSSQSGLKPFDFHFWTRSFSHITMFSASLNSLKTKEIKRPKEKEDEKKTNKGLPNRLWHKCLSSLWLPT